MGPPYQGRAHRALCARLGNWEESLLLQGEWPCPTPAHMHPSVCQPPPRNTSMLNQSHPIDINLTFHLGLNCLAASVLDTHPDLWSGVTPSGPGGPSDARN